MDIYGYIYIYYMELYGYIYIYPHIYTYIPVKSLLRTDQIMLAKINQLLSPNVVGIVLQISRDIK